MQMLPEIIMGVQQPTYKDNSNKNSKEKVNCKQIPFTFSSHKYFLLFKNAIHPV